MTEFVTANDRIFECRSVTTGLNSIEFTMENQDAADLEPFFRGVNELSVSYEDEETPHGEFKDLVFDSITIHEDTSVSVRMRIKSETEKRLDALEESQKKQDETISMIGNASGISV